MEPDWELKTMVIRNNTFSIQIVEATTRQPFREHTRPCDGKVYVEVEPDAEYYIRLQVLPETSKSYYFQCFVDGQKLEHHSRLSTNKPKDTGLWERVDGYSITRALRFTRIPSIDGQHPLKHDSTRCDLQPTLGKGGPMGENKVEIREALLIPNSSTPVQDHKLSQNWKFKTSINGTDCHSNMTPEQGKKRLRTSEGTLLETHPVSKTKSLYKTGPLLEIITLSYCTALGLIHEGVIKKPPLWEFHRLKHSRDSKIDEEEDDKYDKSHLKVQPKRIRLVATTDDGKTPVMAPIQRREYELFDLSQLPDDDDDDEDRFQTEDKINKNTKESNSNYGDHDHDGDSGPAIVSQFQE